MIIVYTSDGCRWCTKAKDLLNEKGLAFEERLVSEHLDEFRALRRMTVPQIVIDGELVGGYTDLVKRLATDYLVTATTEDKI